MAVRLRHTHHIFFRGFAWLNGSTLNGGANLIGFHGAFMVCFFSSLYRRKLGRFLIVHSRAFPDPLTATKSGAKVVNLCRAVFTSLTAVPLFG